METHPNSNAVKKIAEVRDRQTDRNRDRDIET